MACWPAGSDGPWPVGPSNRTLHLSSSNWASSNGRISESHLHSVLGFESSPGSAHFLGCLFQLQNLDSVDLANEGRLFIPSLVRIRQPRCQFVIDCAESALIPVED